MSGSVRTGSYPFMNIADDFGLPYGAVLLFAASRRIHAPEWTLHHLLAIDAVYIRLGAAGVPAFKAAVWRAQVGAA